MKEFYMLIKLEFADVGGIPGQYLGGCDGLLLALLSFMFVDYIT